MKKRSENKTIQKKNGNKIGEKQMDIRENMLPVLGPKGGEEEIEALRDVIESGWWGKGPKVSEFEEKFAEMVGHKYACCNKRLHMVKI